jgi:hypothetical protein
MSFLGDFGDMLAQTCTREPWTGQDSHGQPTYGTAVTHSCRVVHQPTLVRSVGSARSETEGSVRETISHARVWTDNVGWTEKDRITLPDGTTPVILEVRTFPDEAGNHHQVVLV